MPCFNVGRHFVDKRGAGLSRNVSRALFLAAALQKDTRCVLLHGVQSLFLLCGSTAIWVGQAHKHLCHFRWSHRTPSQTPLTLPCPAHSQRVTLAAMWSISSWKFFRLGLVSLYPELTCFVLEKVKEFSPIPPLPTSVWYFLHLLEIVLAS